MRKGQHGIFQPNYTDLSILPKVGDTCKGTLIGKNKLIHTWRLCEDCGKGRWLAKLGGGGFYRYCFSCSTRHRTYSPEYRERQRQTCIVRNTTQPNPIKGKKLPPRSAEHSANISKALVGVPRPEKRISLGTFAVGTIENPIVGDIRYHYELETINSASKSNKYIYVQCPFCKQFRWSDYESHRDSLKRGTFDKCKGCSTKEHSAMWRGGTKLVKGYRHIRLYKGDSYYAMANNALKRDAAYVLEHRLVMAKHLGRLLLNSEVVHHKNGIKDDNRIENLEIMRDKEHDGLTRIEERVRYLENRVEELTQNEREDMLLIRLLLWRLKQFDVEKINGGD